VRNKVGTLKHRAELLQSKLERRGELKVDARDEISISHPLAAGTPDPMQTHECLVEAVAAGEEAVTQGAVATHAAARKRLARWLK